ncbi:MAG: adenylyl-sulfate reductase subunit alpha [Candidatus Hadarchaeota archaeon]
MKLDEINRERLDADLLIIGGGAAGCLAAVEAKRLSKDLKVVIMEKAHIDRSGCLAAGMNAINVYLHPGETPESFTRYVRWQAMGICREDLTLSMIREVNPAVKRVEGWGLPITKDEKGIYSKRGRWNVDINGEALKMIISKAVSESKVTVLNHTVATNYILDGNRVAGAFGFSLRDRKFYIVRAKATIIATGGAAGIYLPNNTGDAHHTMWYSPFNTGAGYAMGIRAGAEMTSFEMRFIALRVKDIIAPTGTLALGFGAAQVNAKGEQYMKARYAHMGGEGAPTPIRVYAPTMEVKAGRGPCYLDTRHLTQDRVRQLKASYLDMYPQMTLWLAANKIDSSKQPIAISGTEPYIVGGHCQAGYWVDDSRKTTLEGLFAAGDVAGGVPYKFVSGCWAEGVIAARSAVEYIKTSEIGEAGDGLAERELERIFDPLVRREDGSGKMRPADLEDELQSTMDKYAGGISVFYEMDEGRLLVARRRLRELADKHANELAAENLHELMLAHDLIDRIDVARVLVEHLIFRKETRWPGYQTRLDYTKLDDENWLCFVNSRRDPATGEIKVFKVPYMQMLPGDRYKG